MSDNRYPILIIGAGREARIALDIANELDVLVYGFMTDDAELLQTEMNEILVVSTLEGKDAETLLAEENVKLVLTEKDQDKRRELAEQLGSYKREFLNLISPSSTTSPFCTLGKGNIMQPGAVIQPNASLGDFNVIGPNAVIESEALIGNYCTFQSGVVIGYEAEIAEDVFIGAGAVIHPGVKIASGVNIGAGSVVLRDVAEDQSVFGNPAQVID